MQPNPQEMASKGFGSTASAVSARQGNGFLQCATSVGGLQSPI
jgi:hypothetical protein